MSDVWTALVSLCTRICKEARWVPQLGFLYEILGRNDEQVKGLRIILQAMTGDSSKV